MRRRQVIATNGPAHSVISATRGTFVPAAAEPERLLRLIESSLHDDKAEDVVVIDLSGRSSFADYMVIASGRSARQVHAMAEHLQEKLKTAGVRGLTAEGLTACDWVLIDAGDVVVHLFRPEIRDFYNLEKMWSLSRGRDLAGDGQG